MQEFICPNGRMSVNGVCPIFEGDDGQVKDFNKPKEKSFFQFDFEKPTENAFEKADNIISKNIGAYNSFVEEKLGISSKAQNVLKVGTAFATGSLMPFVIPFLGGAALNMNQQKQQQAQQEAIARDVARDMQESNRANKTGGYQAGYSRDFMEGPSGGDNTGGSPGSSGPGGSDTMGSF